MASSLIKQLAWGATFAALLGTGLMGGVFLAFSSFVMPALASLTPPQGIAAMQSINVKAVTPLFMAVLFGSTILCAILAVYALTAWSQRGSGFLLLASVLYLAGAFGTTAVFNIPLNNALARVDAASVDGARFWVRFLADWTAWNHFRALSSVLALAAYVVALLRLPK
jgi:uncharacterized membrane protein